MADRLAKQTHGGPDLSVSFTHPMVLRRQGPLGTWYANGIAAEDLEQLAVAVDPLAAGDRLCRRVRDASVVFVARTSRSVTGVTAWKGLMATNEVFYVSGPDGGWIITDHFRNAISSLPVAERAMSDAALLEHYVSAAVFDRLTYSRGVDRLRNGDRCDIDMVSGVVAIDVFSRHQSTATDEPMDRHLARLDGAFEDVVGSFREVDALGVGFSGGVDSTLLLSYLGATGTPITMLPGSAEFDVETEYARQASRLLGRTVEELRLDESDYLRRLEETIETTGTPVDSYITPVMAALFEHPSSTFVVGEAADSVFGSGRGIRRVASALSGASGRALLRALSHAPGTLGRRSQQLGDYATLFAEPADSPDGYAGRSLEYYGDNSITYRIFGNEAITDYYRHLLQGVHDRVDIEVPENDRFFRHIEMTQWRYLFADLAILGNHTAQALGKRQVQPFQSWRVVAEHLKVPARERYVRGLTGKWMIKELLSRRVPEYQVNKRKLATGLPFLRYYANGPLTDFWDRYEIPDVIPAALRDELITKPTAVTWKAMTHAIWLDRVVNNESLQPVAASVADDWSLTTVT